ncbi:matE family protein [Mycobacterium ulcerans str. Harvey]|uniref:MatE family protein n=1 Tax=Mycobacterium ulcerans str. Harvey TaxID=1299332 RepID=A0ABN0QZH1_MYCUL|nr:matE family protein [Mycobacterium ulcerans str. Harvey]
MFYLGRGGGCQVGAAALAAHQVVLQLWGFFALVLDSLAIAAQSLVGRHSGPGTPHTRSGWHGG